jgi:tetratricopeptide (TPR) repeat protein
MSTEIERAREFYEKAHQAEEQNQSNLAEIYYVKSATLFQKIGGMHSIDAAQAFTALSSLRERRGDYSGALCSAKHSARIMEMQGIEFSSRRADEIRLQTWSLIGNLYRHMGRYSEAEQILRHAFDYVCTKFGEEDEETTITRNQLGSLQNYIGELEKAEKQDRDVSQR